MSAPTGKARSPPPKRGANSPSDLRRPRPPASAKRAKRVRSANVALGVSTVRTARGGNAPELNTLVVQYPQIPRPMAVGGAADYGNQRALKQAQVATAPPPQSEPVERFRERADEREAAVEASGF